MFRRPKRESTSVTAPHLKSPPKRRASGDDGLDGLDVKAGGDDDGPPPMRGQGPGPDTDDVLLTSTRSDQATRFGDSKNKRKGNDRDSVNETKKRFGLGGFGKRKKANNNSSSDEDDDGNEDDDDDNGGAVNYQHQALDDDDEDDNFQGFSPTDNDYSAPSTTTYTAPSSRNTRAARGVTNNKNTNDDKKKSNAPARQLLPSGYSNDKLHVFDDDNDQGVNIQENPDEFDFFNLNASATSMNTGNNTNDGGGYGDWETNAELQHQQPPTKTSRNEDEDDDDDHDEDEAYDDFDPHNPPSAMNYTTNKKRQTRFAQDLEDVNYYNNGDNKKGKGGRGRSYEGDGNNYLDDDDGDGDGQGRRYRKYYNTQDKRKSNKDRDQKTSPIEEIPLELDLYNILFLHFGCGKYWKLQLFVFFFIIIIQYGMMGLFFYDLLRFDSTPKNKLGLPAYRVPYQVRWTQGLALPLAILSHKECWRSWNQIFVEYTPILEWPSATYTAWIGTLSFRIVTGWMLILLSFISICQSTTVAQVGLRLQAIVLVGKMDDVAYWLAERGFMGKAMEKATDRVRGITMPSRILTYDDNDEKWIYTIKIISLALVWTILMLSWFVWLFIKQGRSGVYLLDASCPIWTVDFGTNFLLPGITTIVSTNSAVVATSFTSNPYFPGTDWSQVKYRIPVAASRTNNNNNDDDVDSMIFLETSVPLRFSSFDGAYKVKTLGGRNNPRPELINDRLVYFEEEYGLYRDIGDGTTRDGTESGRPIFTTSGSNSSITNIDDILKKVKNDPNWMRGRFSYCQPSKSSSTSTSLGAWIFTIPAISNAIANRNVEGEGGEDCPGWLARSQPTIAFNLEDAGDFSTWRIWGSTFHDNNDDATATTTTGIGSTSITEASIQSISATTSAITTSTTTGNALPAMLCHSCLDGSECNNHRGTCIRNTNKANADTKNVDAQSNNHVCSCPSDGEWSGHPSCGFHDTTSTCSSFRFQVIMKSPTGNGEDDEQIIDFGIYRQVILLDEETFTSKTTPSPTLFRIGHRPVYVQDNGLLDCSIVDTIVNANSQLLGVFFYSSERWHHGQWTYSNYCDTVLPTNGAIRTTDKFGHAIWDGFLSTNIQFVSSLRRRTGSSTSLASTILNVLDSGNPVGPVASSSTTATASSSNLDILQWFAYAGTGHGDDADLIPIDTLFTCLGGTSTTTTRRRTTTL